MSYEEWACPLRCAEAELTGEDGEGGMEVVGTRDCDATLHLAWSFDWPVPTDDDGHPWTREEVALNAYTDGWEVVCENGHTLARHSRSADDNAEPFDMPAVMEAIGAKRVTRDVGAVRPPSEGTDG